MDRMQKMIAAASGSLPKRPNELRGTAARDATVPESRSPHFFQAAWAWKLVAERRIFLILSILPILLSSFVVQAVVVQAV